MKTILALLLLLAPIAQAASTPVQMGGRHGIYPVPSIYQGTVQNISTSGTHAESSAFGSGTQIILVTCSTASYFLITTAGTAVTTSNGTYLPAATPLYVGVLGSQKISVIQAASGGVCSVTEGKGVTNAI